jgi:hypothetical protein
VVRTYNPSGRVAVAAYNLVSGKLSGAEWFATLLIWSRGSEAEKNAALHDALTEALRADGLMPPTDAESYDEFLNRQLAAVEIANGHFGPVAQVRFKGPGYHLVQPLLDALTQRCSPAEARFLAAWRETPGEQPSAIAARLGYRHPERAGPTMLTRLTRRAATL